MAVNHLADGRAQGGGPRNTLCSHGIGQQVELSLAADHDACLPDQRRCRGRQTRPAVSTDTDEGDRVQGPAGPVTGAGVVIVQHRSSVGAGRGARRTQVIGDQREGEQVNAAVVDVPGVAGDPLTHEAGILRRSL